MPDEHDCRYEERWGTVLTKLEYITGTICKHVDEGEREGGFRDILRDTVKEVAGLRQQISAIKKSYWKAGAIGGAVVGVMIKSPEIGHFMLSMIGKIVFAGQ